MASGAQKAAGALTAVLAACAVASPLVIKSEGWVTHTYADPIGIPTACAGVTKNVMAGQTYSDDECEQKTSQALVEHGFAIAQCLPAQLPTDTRAAFTSFAYNIGPAAFCKSSIARFARAGDLPAACSSLRLYVYAGGRKLPGLVSRRAEERALCERGLKGPQHAPG